MARAITAPMISLSLRAVLLAIAGGLLSPSSVIAQDSPAKEIKKGMTADEVRRELGQPQRVLRQVLFRRQLEQWVYPEQSVCVEFVCRPNEEPTVVQIYRGDFR